MQGLKEVQKSKASGKGEFPKYDIINKGQQKFVKRQNVNQVMKTESRNSKYQHASLKASLTTKTGNITVALDFKYMET